jgi:hypothetical protein
MDSARSSPTLRPPRRLLASVLLAATSGWFVAAPAGASAPPDATTTTTTTAPAPAPTTPAPPTTAPVGVPAPGSTTPPTTSPPAPAPRNIPVVSTQIAHILATIRYVESRGDYDAPPNRGRASGAYQFITSTWDNYAGYSEAYLAPPEIQDERAILDVEKFLAQWNNDVSMVPIMWYYPRAARDVTLMDIVPVPSAGNVLTVREYQQRWLGVWAFLSGQDIPRPLTREQALGRLGLPPELPDPEPVEPGTPAIERTARLAYPVLGPSRVAVPECGDADDVTENAGAGPDATAAEIAAAGLCAEEAPGIVFGVKLQPVLAVVDGVVTDIDDELGSTIAMTITDITGRSYRMEGFNDDNPGTDDGAAPPHLRLSALARVGATVRAGQVIGFMGNSSPLPLGVRADVPTDATVDIPTDAVAPHIRLTIEDLDGTPVDAYGPVIDALFAQACTVGTGPWAGWPTGGTHEPVVIETTDDNRAIDSEWIITDSGQVTAAGWAALIYPSEHCGWAPEIAFGPGAAGTTQVPVDWLTPIRLPTPIWIALASETDDARSIVPLVRP